MDASPVECSFLDGEVNQEPLKGLGNYVVTQVVSLLVSSIGISRRLGASHSQRKR